MADIKWSAFPSVGNLATGDILVGLRAGANAQFSALTIPWTVPNGGTGNTTFTAYSLICAGTTATGTFQNVSGVGTANQVLTSNGAGQLPSWQNVPGITGQALTRTDDTNVTLTLGGTPATALLESTSLTLGWTGTLSLARGGTGASLTASDGGIFYSTASSGAILSGTSTAQQLLMSGASAAPSWSTSTYPTTNAINTLLYASSANVMAALATAVNGVLITSNTGTPSWLANSGTAGFVLTANSGAPPSWQPNSSGGLEWIEAPSASFTATVNTGYYTKGGTPIEMLLPEIAAAGTVIGIVGGGIGWSIKPNAAQLIYVLDAVSATYPTGAVNSTSSFDAVELLCVTANTDWVARSIVSSGLDVQ